ncbi:MAG: BatA domain-containing protein [Marinoscillum sp.]
MTFLNPSAFWAFSLLIIPIIIHLFSFRRYKKVFFSNLAFLRDVKQQKKSSSTLKKLLVLISRLLLISCLVMAFARPVILDENEIIKGNSQLIYLDNSFSMQQSDPQGEPLLYQASAVVSNYLKSQEEGDEIRFINNDKSYVISSYGGDEQVFSEVDFSKSSLGLKGLIDRADLYQSSIIHVYSDFQKSTFNLGKELDDTTRQFVFHKLKSNQSKNIYVDSVYLQKPSSVGEENTIIVKVKNTGRSIATDVLIKLQRNSRQLAALTLDLAPGQLTTVEFPLVVNDAISGNYEIDVQEGSVVFDNRFYFTISESLKPNVSILTDELAIESARYFQKVYSNEHLFNLTVNDISNASFQSITNSDLLILVGLESIPDWLISQLDQIQGKMLIIPSYRVNLSSYSRLFSLPIQYKLDTKKETLSVKSLEHPILEGVFEERNDRVGLPEVNVILEPKGYFENIFNTNSKDPFLIKSGNKPYYLFTGPISDSLTNFHKHSLFVPVMYKLSQPIVSNPLYYRMSDELIDIAIDSVSRNALLQLKSNHATYIPGYRYETSNRLLLDLPSEVRDPGVYELVVQGDTLKTLALNYGKDESELAVYSNEEISEFISGRTNIAFEEINTDLRFAQSNEENDRGISLWKYALLLALIFLITESLLLRFLK